MVEAIESKAFRAAARRNCISYLGIPIYVENIPELHNLALPTFRTQSPDGAVSQLFSTLVNMNTQIEQIRKNLRMTDSTAVPGVSYNEIEGMSFSLNGPVYFEDAGQYRAFTETIASIAKNYGWIENVSEKMSTAVYHPAKNDFTNSDPVQSAIKGMVMGAISDRMDVHTLIMAGDSIKENTAAETQYFEARDRYLGGSIFNMAAIQYYANTPLSVQNAWGGMGDEMIPVLMIDGAPKYWANIPYMPTTIGITPGAYVNDNSGLYPTKCDVAIQMANPLGGLFANFTVVDDGKASVGDEARGTTIANMPM